MAHLEKQAANPAGGRADAPRGLGQAVLLALDKDAQRRPPTATAYANLVGAAASGR